MKGVTLLSKLFYWKVIKKIKNVSTIQVSNYIDHLSALLLQRTSKTYEYWKIWCQIWSQNGKSLSFNHRIFMSLVPIWRNSNLQLLYVTLLEKMSKNGFNNEAYLSVNPMIKIFQRHAVSQTSGVWRY